MQRASTARWACGGPPWAAAFDPRAAYLGRVESPLPSWSWAAHAGWPACPKNRAPWERAAALRSHSQPVANWQITARARPSGKRGSNPARAPPVLRGMGCDGWRLRRRRPAAQQPAREASNMTWVSAGSPPSLRRPSLRPGASSSAFAACP